MVSGFRASWGFSHGKGSPIGNRLRSIQHKFYKTGMGCLYAPKAVLKKNNKAIQKIAENSQTSSCMGGVCTAAGQVESLSHAASMKSGKLWKGLQCRCFQTLAVNRQSIETCFMFKSLSHVDVKAFRP
jgi:hypothetical protein